MPLTPNFSIYYRDTSTPASLETESALQADSTDDALTLITGNRQIQTFRWADAAERAAQTGMVAGDVGYQVDTAAYYIYGSGTWVATPEDTGWITPSFSNGWAAAAGYPVGYRRRNGIVYLRGRVTGGSTAVGFILPAGFLPGQQMLFSGVDGGSATARAWIFINAAGNVQFQSGQVAQLDEIRFIAEA